MKRVLNLSKHLKFPKHPSVQFTKFTFSGGEEHIKINPLLVNKNDHIAIASNITSSQSFMETLLATDALKLMGIKKIDLIAPYFPYARQDRVMVDGEPFSLKMITRILNTQNYNKVFVLDPHSDITNALMDNIQVIDNADYLRFCWNDIKSNNGITDNNKKICLVSPDAGAEKKIWKIAKNLNAQDVILGSKRRDVTDGKILDTCIVGDVHNKMAVIYDDIIDGGATFISLAKVLKQQGASKLYLICSHGIFSKGTDVLNMFDGIYTTDSFKITNEKNVKTIGIDTFFDYEK